ncbi:MAG: winged helix-turn-helix domain-containing protein [Bryobacteraceae bacterium]|nr:winged helix-turn-helix domain-containing protein [Bryobacteraceae bacterium]
MLSGRHRIGRYEVDFDTNQVWLADRKLALHWRGFEALRELAGANGGVVSRERLFEALWPGAVVDESNLGKVISQLRRALEEGDPGTGYIETLPGVGYRLVVTPQPPPPVVPSSAFRLPREIIVAAALAGLAALGASIDWTPRSERLGDARQAMERGKELLRTRDRSRAAEAVGLLRRATELNPDSAEAYSALAHALNLQGGPVANSLGEKSPALLAAWRAVEIDPRCGGCNGTLGLYLLSHGWQWDEALRRLERAIELSPEDFNIRPSYALALLVKGRAKEALDQIDIAIKGAPFHAGYHSIRARILYVMKRYNEAVEAADRVRGIQPSEGGGWTWRSQALLQLGETENGIRAMAGAGFPEAERAAAAVRQGGRDAGLRILIEAAGDARPKSWQKARWKTMLGDHDGAIAHLEVARQDRLFEAMFIAVDPVFEPLWRDPRFRGLVERMRLNAVAGGVR